MTNTANIFNIQHFSVNDGPGIRTVIFFKGCPLNCVWCHNPESKSSESELSFSEEKCICCKKCESACKNGVHSFNGKIHVINRSNCKNCGQCIDVCPVFALETIGKTLTFDEIMSDLEKDDVFFGNTGGITFSGGEPFIQFNALYNLLKMCKEKGYTTCIETSGFTTKENIEKATKYTDFFLFDIKETNKENHKKYVGCDNETILQNLEVLDSLNVNVTLRCPIIQNINDREDHFLKIAELSVKYRCVKSIEFMPYHPLGIQKSQQIGKNTEFNEKSFMNRETIERYCQKMKTKTACPIKIN